MSAPDGKKPSYTQYRMLLTASSIGLAVAIAIFLGLALGLFLDRYFGTKPWLMIAGLLLGVAAGFRNLWVMAARVERSEAAKSAKEKTTPSGGESESSAQPESYVTGDFSSGAEQDDFPRADDALKELIGPKEFEELARVLNTGVPAGDSADDSAADAPAGGSAGAPAASGPGGKPRPPS